MHDDNTAPAAKRFSVARLIPLLVLIAGLVAFFALGLHEYLSFEALKLHRERLLAWVDTYGVLAGLAFLAIYALAIAFSIPAGAVLTVTGGFLFGTWLGTAYVVVGATVGAIAVFLIARTSVGEALRAKAGPALKKMEEGFRENALSYLLVLRLIPLFPFFIVNIVPAFLGVSLRTYAIATLLGIIPGTFVYASVGAGLGSVFDMDEKISLSAVLTPEVITALVGLSLLSLVPVVYKRIKARRARA